MSARWGTHERQPGKSNHRLVNVTVNDSPSPWGDGRGEGGCRTNFSSNSLSVSPPLFTRFEKLRQLAAIRLVGAQLDRINPR